MAARILDINPDCRVTSMPMLYNEESKETFFAQRYDYIVDAIDLVSCKLSDLARVMRRELRNRGILHHTVLYSEELPQTPEALEAPPPGRRSIPASVSWVPSCAGLMLAGYVVQELAAQ